MKYTKEAALQALEDMDDYSRMGVPGGIAPVGAYGVLKTFIEEASLVDKLDIALALSKNLNLSIDEMNIEAAAMTLAECTDYPWAHMPEQGRQSMRESAQRILLAAVPAAPAQQEDVDRKSVATVRVTHEGYGMELSTYVIYALPEGLHDLYARPGLARD